MLRSNSRTHTISDHSGGSGHFRQIWQIGRLWPPCRKEPLGAESLICRVQFSTRSNHESLGGHPRCGRWRLCWHGRFLLARNHKSTAHSAPAATKEGTVRGRAFFGQRRVRKRASRFAQDGVGGRVVGKFFYANDQNKIMIFDLKDPLAPEMVGVPCRCRRSGATSVRTSTRTARSWSCPNTVSGLVDGQPQHSDEMPSTSWTSRTKRTRRSSPRSTTAPPTRQTACSTVSGHGDLTERSSTSAIRPKPKLMKQEWGDGMPTNGGGRDLEGSAPGLVLTATQPGMLLDVRKDPSKPKILAVGSTSMAASSTADDGSSRNDKFLLMGGETNHRSAEAPRSFMTWDARSGRRPTASDDRRVPPEERHLHRRQPGRAPVGCSSHWIEPEPSFNNGGIVAGAFFDTGRSSWMFEHERSKRPASSCRRPARPGPSTGSPTRSCTRSTTTVASTS